MLGSQQNWIDFAEISYIPPTLTYVQPPPLSISPWQKATIYDNWWTYLDTSLSPKLELILGFTQGVVYFMGLDKFIMTRVHHHSIIQSDFIAPSSSFLWFSFSTIKVIHANDGESYKMQEKSDGSKLIFFFLSLKIIYIHTDNFTYLGKHSIYVFFYIVLHLQDLLIFETDFKTCRVIKHVSSFFLWILKLI